VHACTWPFSDQHFSQMVVADKGSFDYGYVLSRLTDFKVSLREYAGLAFLTVS
jgi:hypothetical protein